MELTILYEDANIVAIDKPSGLMTHPDGRGEEATASDWFSARYPQSRDVGEAQALSDGAEFIRPGVVHRLDKETSGVLVFAKTREAHSFLKESFKHKQVNKTYLAFVYGVPKERKGVITFPIGRSRKDFRLRSAQPKAKGMLREAITHFEVVSHIGTHALLSVSPKTGRTHQIRVHLKAIHHPVVGDPLYAPNHPSDLGFSRLGLHAYRLSIPLPQGGEVTITAPVPKELTKALCRFPGTEEFLVASA